MLQSYFPNDADAIPSTPLTKPAKSLLAMFHFHYRGHKFKTLPAFVEWAKANGVKVISETIPPSPYPNHQHATMNATDEMTITLPTRYAAVLALFAARTTYDDCLRRTDGYDSHPETGDQDQAYDFINALRALRKALDEADA